ncbi:uncharacterized protein LOC141639242 [Silene latifolia]|uniref:uncharacterized protein LOC141639242 n=1 Tax=Silene latifolia TaxID=37657 RepID=UPI003D77967D
MNAGDENTHYFHCSIKARRSQNRVLSIKDMSGRDYNTNADIKNAFLVYYMALLGNDHYVTPVCLDVVRAGSTVSEEQATAMIRDISEEEIRSALMSIPADKYPGPDGFTSQFFKDSYSIVGPDVIAAVKEFFNFGKLLLNEVLGDLVSSNQSAFALDLMRYFSSIKIRMHALKTFDEALGLKVNQEKSKIYMNGISPGDRNKCLILSGFRVGNFPFRYLGILISFKRLFVNECNKLTEKMVVRIRSWSWGARKLSYAGRLVLIKAVLSQLHSYWCRIFVLPSSVLKKIDSICKKYLWPGDLNYKLPLVAWNTCCRPLTEDGLDIINCSDWNKAMLAKYTWWIDSKADHLWIKWVNAIYIKGRDWWSYSPSPSSSWT